ncbi:hypothetical protein BofuT4_uP100260.1 [Botrytis cinerea T4]|uniref:Uncharacterized protein n=1 Tax=Botryotinia fuckeliana (strain T4) TaxID=999810 RepID=G2YBN1_BOTF4|nr:hypothetical protein BofuT4_uP100260.1 [Botrytis cinerea T4]
MYEESRCSSVRRREFLLFFHVGFGMRLRENGLNITRYSMD